MLFPPEFKMYMKDPTTRAAFISENTSPNPSDCKNCGGVGYLFLFVATGGPFRDPTQNKVNHWSPEGWWTGKTQQALCPVCHNVRHVEGQELVRPVQDKDKELISNLREQWWQKE